MRKRTCLLLSAMVALQAATVTVGAATPTAAQSNTNTVSITTRCISLQKLLAKLSTHTLELSCATTIAHQKLQMRLVHQPIGQVLKDLAQLLDGAWIRGNTPHSLYFYMRKSAVQKEDTWWQLYWSAFKTEEAERPARLLSVLNSNAPDTTRYSVYGPPGDTTRMRSTLWLMKHSLTLFRDLPPAVKLDLANASLSPNDFALLPSGIADNSTVNVVPFSQLPPIFLKAAVQSLSVQTNRRETSAQIPSGTVLAVSVQNKMPTLRAFRAVDDIPGIAISSDSSPGGYVTAPPFPLSASRLKERIRARREESRSVPQTWHDLETVSASTVWQLHALTASDLTSSIGQMATGVPRIAPGMGGLHYTTAVPSQPLPLSTHPANAHVPTFGALQYTNPPSAAVRIHGGNNTPKIPQSPTPLSRSDALTYLGSKGGMQFLADYYSTPCTPLTRGQLAMPLHGSLPENLDVLSHATGTSWTKANDGIILLRDNHWYRDDRLEVPNSLLHTWLKDFRKLQAAYAGRSPADTLSDQWNLRVAIETTLTPLQLENGLIWWMTKIHKSTVQPFAWIGAQIGNREEQLGFWHSLSHQQRRLLAQQNLLTSDLTTRQKMIAMHFYPQLACLAAPEKAPRLGIVNSRVISVDSTAPYLQFPYAEIQVVRP